MTTLLYISLPGSVDITHFIPSIDKEGIEFSFQPFADDSFSKTIKIRLKESEVRPNSIPLKEASDQFVYSQDHYTDLLKRTIQKIKEEQLGKIVISRAQDFDISNPKAFEMFEKLVKAYPNACVYLFLHPEAGLWIGATPEVLVKGENGLFETMSLAGTRELGDEKAFEAKEELEQSLVTQFIENKLKSTSGLEEVQVGPKQKLQAGNLIHFVNHIKAKYSPQLNIDEVLKELHPTPAVGGFPKTEALEFIRQNEKHDRSYYSGYFGIKNKESFHYFVNLRCMQLFTNKMTLYAGGGITAASDPQKEWEETKAKMRTLLNVLAPETAE